MGPNPSCVERRAAKQCTGGRASETSLAPGAPIEPNLATAVASDQAHGQNSSILMIAAGPLVRALKDPFMRSAGTARTALLVLALSSGGRGRGTGPLVRRSSEPRPMGRWC